MMAIRIPRIPRLLLALAFVVGPIIGFAVYQLAATVERDRARTLLASRVAGAAFAIEGELRADLEILYSLKSLFETAGKVTMADFSGVAQPFLARHQCTQALEWIPRVPHSARSAHERWMRGEGFADYRITEQSTSGEAVVAGERDEYYPVAFVVPLEGNKPAIGFDLASDSHRLDALVRASRNAEPALTDPISLVQGTATSPGVLAFMSVSGGGPQANDAGADVATGFVLTVFRVDSLLHRAQLGPGDAPFNTIQFELVDDDVGGRPLVIHETPVNTGARPIHELTADHPIDIGGQHWRLVARPTADYLASLRTRQPVLLGIGAAIGWELMIGLFVVLGKSSRDRLNRRYVRRITNILESLNDGVIVADKAGRILFANQAAAAVSGTARPDVPPSAWSEQHGFFLPGTNQPFPPEELPLARAIRGEVIDDVELQVRNPHVPNGIRVSVRGGPMFNERGQVQGGVVVFRDITERKKAEERMQRLSNAVEQTADAVVITDRDGTIEYVNPAFEVSTGYSSTEAVGKNPRILKSGLQSPEFYRDLWKTILGGEAYRGMTVNRTKSGSHYHAEQTITPMTNGDGEITHFVSVFKDMTERRKIQEQEIEVEVAAMVQRRLFPDAPPRISGYDLAGAVFPAEATSGDYYDFVPMTDGALGIVVADVTGHGLGPALVMAETRAYLRSLAQRTSDLVEITGTINSFLVADLDDRFFVTMLLTRLEPDSGRLSYVNAGHPCGYVLDGAGAVTAEMDSTCLPVGLFLKQWRCVEHELTLDHGEIAVLITDGVLESKAPNGSDFGFERLLEVVKSHRHLPAQEIIEELYEAIQDFTQRETQLDDVTVVICRREPEAT